MAENERNPSLFLQFIGDKPKWRVIDFLLENRLRDFTKTEIAKGANLSWASLYQHWDDIERKKIVKLTRVVGRARLYQLNEKSPLVVLLKNIESTLIRDAADTAEKEAVKKLCSFSPKRKRHPFLLQAKSGQTTFSAVDVHFALQNASDIGKSDAECRNSTAMMKVSARVVRRK